MKNHYARGADFERTVRAKLYELGALLVLKGGGSKSPGAKFDAKVDLIALMPTRWVVAHTILIQAKCGKTPPSKKEVQGLRQLSRSAGVQAFIASSGRTMKEVILTDVEEPLPSERKKVRAMWKCGKT